jgi:peptidyl-prolyl cis-trans isomerase C
MTTELEPRQGQGPVYETPDGKRFAARSGRAAGQSPLAAAGDAARDIARALAKAVATVWRLAEALDSALWRGAKLIAFSTIAFLRATGRAAGDAFLDVFQWLRSRAGLAYAAASGVVLIVSALWIADEIGAPDAAPATFDSFFRPPVDAEDPILARFDGRYVHLSDIEAAARVSGALKEGETLTPESAYQRKLVEAFIEQRLIARAALAEGLQRDPAVARRVAAARDRILGAEYMKSRIAAATAPDKVRRLYDSQSDVTRLGDEVRARHIVVASEAEAQAIIMELAAGQDFAALARARSLDRATAPLGGEIGWFTREMMSAALAAAAFSAAPGEIAAPFATEFGWHVLEVTGRRRSAGVAFKDVEDDIRRFLAMKAVEEAVGALETGNDVVYYRPDDKADSTP